MIKAGDRRRCDLAEALFASSVPTGTHPSREEVDVAVIDALERFRGTIGCAAEMGAAYGEQPEIAIIRIRWSLQVVASVYGTDICGVYGRPTGMSHP
ncbi:hypothetical protein LFM09_17815 [Lentzea alba]|uniref:hypothetical protein n=1 Tax=Lentzea alba TaxID=2714351 RepID=UPI0039BF7E07